MHLFVIRIILKPLRTHEKTPKYRSYHFCKGGWHLQITSLLVRVFSSLRQRRQEDWWSEEFLTNGEAGAGYTPSWTETLTEKVHSYGELQLFSLANTWWVLAMGGEWEGKGSRWGSRAETGHSKVRFWNLTAFLGSYSHLKKVHNSETPYIFTKWCQYIINTTILF